MSILYGLINLDGQPASPEIFEKMRAALSKYTCDSESSLVKNNVVIGFMNQYITEESQLDKVPCYDTESGLYFVCDAIIDNREELISLLGLRSDNLSDSDIIFSAYKKWGANCTHYLLGDFAFVIYNQRLQRVQLFRDHMGKRLLYYRLDNHILYFSTLIGPLIASFNNSPAINEEYLVTFLSIEEILQEIKAGETIYKDINYVSPASYLTVTDDTISSITYWNIYDINEDRGLKYIDYKNQFKDLFTESVRCRLRTNGNVGSFLSGGLDSSSVACTAASLLSKQGKILHTFTSVPLAGYTDWVPKSRIADESDAVVKMQNMYPNIHAHFINCKDKNSLNVAARMLEIQEQPYKFIENSYWLNEIPKQASLNGCKVILSGSIGNSTISFGSFYSIMFEHLCRLRLIHLVKDLSAYCRLASFSRSKMLKVVTKMFCEAIFFHGNAQNGSKMVREEYRDKYNVNKKLRSIGLKNKPVLRIKEVRHLMLHPAIINQASSAMAKLSLANNICERDPTADKRIVELTLRLPYDCYFDRLRGFDRGLIRQSMQGSVPDEILFNRRRGLQSADYLDRININWPGFLQAFTEALISPNELAKYLDLEYLLDTVHSHNDLPFSFDTIFGIRNIIIIDNCIRFLNML